MEVFSKEYLKFNSNTFYEVKKELNIHQPGAIDEIINNFEEWINKQNHFTKKDFSRDFLERSVILSKGSLERANRGLEKLCTIKTLLHQYFSEYDVVNLKTFHNFMLYAVIPPLMEDNYRLSVCKIVSNDLDAKILLELTRYVVMMVEYVKANDFCLGFSCIIDFQDIDVLSLALKVDLVELKQLVYMVTEGYGLRLKSIHLLSSSKAIEAIVNIFKQIFSAKLSGRIHVHRSLESLHEKIPRQMLPEDLGGDEKSVKELHQEFCQVLGAKENMEYFKENFRAGTNESLRQADSYNSEVLGMPGSFRTLNVD